MTAAATLQSGKGHRDENFPVASFLIRRRHRSVILAFYRFARAADDVADHPTASAEEKLRLLEEMDRTLTGELDSAPEALSLRRMLDDRNLSVQHGLMLLEAFRRDVTTLRYASWDDLMEYCRYSAMPVGRFVLDVHGERRDIWPANDALCAALQVINHLQDCGKDYRSLDRVYIPQDAFVAAAARIEDLGASNASPALHRTIMELAQRAKRLLEEGRPLAGQIQDTRLAFEVTVIQRLAEDLTSKLLRRDPLHQRVHHAKLDLIPLLLRAMARFVSTRFSRDGRVPAMRSAP
jgi:squalene synthase HpnC